MWCNGFPEIYAQLGGSICQIWTHFEIYSIWNLFGVMVFQRSILDWRSGWGQSAMGTCALCYIWNLFGVMVFQISMINWKGVHLPNMNSLWNLLYVKHIWCNGFQKIYCQLMGGPSALSICTCFYMWNLFGVVVLHRSMVNWLGSGVNLPNMNSLQNLLYMKHIWCNGFPEIYDQLEGGPSAKYELTLKFTLYETYVV